MLDNIINNFSYLDLIAITWFVICLIGYNYITSSKQLSSNNIINALHTQRLLWMRTMAERSVRLVDIQIVHGFTQANGFFATTTVFVLGGLAAVLGSGESARMFMDSLPFTVSTNLFVWQIKVCLLIIIFVIAFFKFIWAYRLSNYNAIAIGATPNHDSADNDLKEIQLKLAARLSNLAARHSYVGLRCYYFAIAAIGWFIHPVVFMISTTWVILVLYRREFLSRSAHAIHKAVQAYLEKTDKNASDT